MGDIFKKGGIAKYIQVREILQKRITSGSLAPGDKMPTERELAEELKISRNTVSAAYRMLEDEGLITSTQGKGTFVSGKAGVPVTSRKEKMIDAVDRALDTAQELGFSAEEFVGFATIRAREYSTAASRVNLLFVDCNREQLFVFSEAMRKNSGVQVQTALLEDLPGLKDTSLVTRADLIVTTFRHREEVAGLTGRDDILTIATSPNVSSLVGIATMSRSEKVGVVSSGRQFWDIFLRALDTAGIPADNFIYYRPETDLHEFIRQHRVLIVTPLMEKTVRAHIRGGAVPHIVPFAFTMDTGSFSLVTQRIAAVRAGKRQHNKEES